MSTFEDFFSGNEIDWIDALPIYQQKAINALLEQGKSFDDAAIAWLTANGPTNTFPYGTQRSSGSIFFEKLVEEIEEFICGEDHYVEDRKKLLTGAEATKAYFIGTISYAIAPVVHTSAPLIAPPIALVLLIITKIGRNAWCNMRYEKRQNASASNLDTSEADSQK